MTRARQDRLLTLLMRDGDWMTAATAADALGVTPRSVRSYVTAVNGRIPGGTAIESGPQGYRAGPDAVAALRAHDVLGETRALAVGWARAAIDELEPLPAGPVKEALVAFAQALADRAA